MSKSKVTHIFLCEDQVNNRKNLFRMALLHAKNGKVLYIVQDELDELPELSQDLSLVNRHILKMMNFLYAHNLQSLIESVASLPNWQHIPITIILDNLSDYCNVKNLHNACGIVSLLIDTGHSCANALKTTCNLYISINKEAVGDEYCNVLKNLYGSNSHI